MYLVQEEETSPASIKSFKDPITFNDGTLYYHEPKPNLKSFSFNKTIDIDNFEVTMLMKILGGTSSVAFGFYNKPINDSSSSFLDTYSESIGVFCSGNNHYNNSWIKDLDFKTGDIVKLEVINKMFTYYVNDVKSSTNVLLPDDFIYFCMTTHDKEVELEILS